MKTKINTQILTNVCVDTTAFGIIRYVEVGVELASWTFLQMISSMNPGVIGAKMSTYKTLCGEKYPIYVYVYVYVVLLTTWIALFWILKVSPFAGQKDIYGSLKNNIWMESFKGPKVNPAELKSDVK